MALPRRRYSRLPVGLLEDLPATVSRGTSARELLACIILSSTRRTIPGLLRMGEAALAEELNWPLPTVKKRLRELEAANIVIFERALRDLLVLGIIEGDGPKTEQSTKAMARQARELKPSRVRDEVNRAIVETLSDGNHDKLIEVWRAEFRAVSTAESEPESTPESTSLPVLRESELTERPHPLQPPAAVAVAWGRLPSPPFAAAAAADLARVEEVLGLPTYAALLHELTCSKWLNASKFTLTGGTPTLRGLLGKADLVQRICAGEFRDPNLKPACGRCRADHNLLDACSPRCDDCEAHHDESYTCEWRRRREEVARQPELWNPRTPDLPIAEEVPSMVGVAAEGEPPPSGQRLRDMLPAGLRASLERHTERTS